MKWQRHEHQEESHLVEGSREKRPPCACADFGLRVSGFFRTSVFGFRMSQLMRLGTVIGRVTLSVTVPALEGARWLIVSPFTREHFQRGTEAPPGLSKDPS